MLVRRSLGLTLSVAVLIAGCGKGNPTSTPSAATRAALTPQMEAFSSGVLLTRADLPADFRAARLARNPYSGGFWSELQRCVAGVAQAAHVSGATSRRFQLDTAHPEGGGTALTLLPIESVYSTVYFTAGATQAARMVERAAGAEAMSCLSRTEKVPSQQIVAKTIPFGESQAYSLQVTVPPLAREHPSSGHESFTHTWYAFSVGPAVVTLQDAGDPQPFPAALALRLLRLLHARALAHPLA